MSRPAVEVADILRAQGSRFLNRYQSSFGYQKLKAFRAIQNCRTKALGGHLDACLGCSYQEAISYNSCRNRHCPKCQAQARQRWLAAREREVLPTNYFHVIFSVPQAGEGTIIGTLQYMAPEQLEGKEADVRTDIFAFGAIAFEM